MSRGKLIIVEGGDAVGKNTQTDMLIEYIEKEKGVIVDKISFPRYETPIGQAILRHLKKEITTTELNHHTGGYSKAPEDAMVFQSLMLADKCEAAGEIKQRLAAGDWIICDRYFPSAIVYGSIDGLSEQWLWDIHDVLPWPDLSILLHVPLKVALERRPELRDRYEADFEHRQKVLDKYHEVWDSMGSELGFHKISSLFSVDEVQRQIRELVNDM